MRKDPNPLTCLFCGEPESVEILEVWSPREFQLGTCCDGLHAVLCDEFARDPKAAAQFLRTGLGPGKGLDELTGMRSRRIIDDGLGGLVIDWQLEVVPITLQVAKVFVGRHHRHCPPPVGWRFGAGITNGSELIGVCTVGRPVARALDASRIVEVNRMCVRTDIAQGLAWNACSQLYGWAAREAVRKGFQKVITYTLQDEPGTTLKAAGWVVEHVTKARSRDTPSRRRVDKTPVVAKNRWTPAAMATISGTVGRAPRLSPANSVPIPGLPVGLAA